MFASLNMGKISSQLRQSRGASDPQISTFRIGQSSPALAELPEANWVTFPGSAGWCDTSLSTAANRSTADRTRRLRVLIVGHAPTVGVERDQLAPGYRYD